MRDIYLAGPIDQADDPVSWRDWMKSTFGENYFVDPIDYFPDEYQDNREEVREWCEKKVTECDSVLVGGYSPDIATVGTIIEMKNAIDNDVPVVMVYPGDSDDISPFINPDYGGYCSQIVNNYTSAFEYCMRTGVKT